MRASGHSPTRTSPRTRRGRAGQVTTTPLNPLHHPLRLSPLNKPLLYIPPRYCSHVMYHTRRLQSDAHWTRRVDRNLRRRSDPTVYRPSYRSRRISSSQVLCGRESLIQNWWDSHERAPPGSQRTAPTTQAGRWQSTQVLVAPVGPARERDIPHPDSQAVVVELNVV